MPILTIVLAIGLITYAVIKGVFSLIQRIKKEHKNISVNDKNIEKKLQDAEGKSAKISLNINYFDEDENKKIEAYVNNSNDTKISTECKDNLITFINSICYLINETKNGGENSKPGSFDLDDIEKVLYRFKFDKYESIVKIQFTFYSKIFFSFLTSFIEYIKDKKINNFCEDYISKINKYNFNNEDVNNFEIKLKL